MDVYKFNLSFKGQLVENSVDAFDVANTILAASYALQEVATVKLGEQTSRNLHLNIAAFKEGSLTSEFMYFLSNAASTIPPLLPLVPNVFEASKTVLDGLKTYIDVRKMLRGKPPESAKAIDGGNVVLNITGNSAPVTVQMSDFRLLQSTSMAKNISKATKPLREKDSLLEEISIIPDGDVIDINKDEAPYFEAEAAFQKLPQVKYKGIVTKIDSKVRSGYISTGSKRIPFSYSESLSHEKFVILVESLKQKLQIFLIGEVTMDYESNPQSIFVTDVESEIQLF